MDVIGLATSGVEPAEKVSESQANYIMEAATVILDPASTSTDIENAIDKATQGFGADTAEYIREAIDYKVIELSATDPFEIANAISDYNESLKNADLSQYGNMLNRAENSVDVYLDSKGKLMIEDKQNTNTPMQFSISDYDKLDVSRENFSFSFMANDAIKIEDPSISFFGDLDNIIESVRNGEFQMDSDNANPRSLGINNSLNTIDHILDHVTKVQTTIGSYSNALQSAQERSELLSVNVQTVRSSVIDVDLAEAYLQFQQISSSYQATLSTVAQINSMSLLNYM